IDGVSWRILLEDLQTAYEQLSRGEPVSLPPKTTSYQRWSRKLRDYVEEGGLGAEVDYWLGDRWRRIAPAPLDHVSGENTVSSARRVLFSLDPEETRSLLQEMPKAFHVSVQESLLAALAQTLARWTGAPSVLLDLEGHGREDLFEDV